MSLWSLLLLLLLLLGAEGKYMEGELKTGDNWAFLARFCFLSLEGKFEYDIEYPEVGLEYPEVGLEYPLVVG